MSVARKEISFAQQISIDRHYNPYIMGGCWNPFDRTQGTDCSDSAGKNCSASVHGTAMNWPREVSTESWRPPAMGGNADVTSGPYGSVMVGSPNDFPPDAAVLIALHHGDGSAADSHMWVQVDKLKVETHGYDDQFPNGATVLNDGVNFHDDVLDVHDVDGVDGQYGANNWWYIPGPIIEDGTPIPTAPSPTTGGGTPVTQPVIIANGVDYSGPPPGGAVLAAAGYAFACRYVFNGSPGLPYKMLTKAEADDLWANSVDPVSNYESTGTDALNGSAQGAADAQDADSNHQAAGGPSDRPIYFSLDWDESDGQDPAVFAYFQGVASVIGLGRTGVYGGYWICKRLLDAGLVTWAWQTEAWSDDPNQLGPDGFDDDYLDPRVNILQRNASGYYTAPNGTQCDINAALTADYGQWHATSPAAPPSPTPAPAPITSDTPLTNAQMQDLYNWTAVIFQQVAGIVSPGLPSVLLPGSPTPFPAVWPVSLQQVLGLDQPAEPSVKIGNMTVAPRDIPPAPPRRKSRP